ncbi:J domain-containing protein [Oscillatoria sp. FACHB-1407]|uniref:J domain-containing protein n=1 Tax=Oscillatoria sp. FACHB-1407 TaxID=2692847 RepID=UPI001685D6BA|nr:J domain-containing protein [Oscillatoria sp. FACHB-1407]MBD2462131.1 J domain-containing protein [Oscillatoria sp. FACHB-1407]
MSDDLTSNYYQVLGLTPSASVQQIRRTYRELSKLYHPDTTELPDAIATAKFQLLNEAYATLSSPEKRAAYDLKIGYSRFSVMQVPLDLNRPVSESRSYRSSAYLDPTDRPLSAGEIFALFILGLTFVACLILVIAIGITRGEHAFQPLTATNPPASAEILEVAPLDAQSTPIDSPPEQLPELDDAPAIDSTHLLPGESFPSLPSPNS